MSRRRPTAQSSLELLLDTICNTFGGVLFIAILVVMLLQQSSSGPSDTKSEPTSPVELQSLALRLQTATAELQRLQENQNSQQTMVETFAPDALREQVALRHAVTRQQQQLQTTVDELLAENAELASGVEAIVQANRRLNTDLEDALAQRAQAEAALTLDRESRVEEVRMPVVRTTRGKEEIGLILRYGRLYVWHRYGPGVRRLGLNTDDFVITGEQGGHLSTRAKPNGGVALSDSAESRDAVRKVLQQFSPESCYLVVIARPDSFPQFRFLRDRALEMGFEYRLMPTEMDTAIVDRGGTGGKVQ